METARVGKVAVENTAYHFDKAYDYLIPQTLWAKAEKGCRVLVPVGGGNRTRQGLLMDVEEICAERTCPEEGLKSVNAVLDQAPLPLDQVCQNERNTALHIALQSLDEDYQDVLYLRFVSELNNHEIAHALDITPEYAAVKIMRAKKALKKALVFCRKKCLKVRI